MILDNVKWGLVNPNEKGSAIIFSYLHDVKLHTYIYNPIKEKIRYVLIMIYDEEWMT